MEEIMRLFSYKMTHDTGFAPNPYGEHLTLATCKPGIRCTKEVSDWVAGFTCQALCGDAVGQERLIYLMRVSEKLPLRDYCVDPRFQCKNPATPAAGVPPGTGDNIYRPLREGAATAKDFEQLKNPHHDCGNMETDISGEYVLIADEFYYFGKEALALPEDIRPSVPPGPSPYGSETESSQARRFIEYVKSLYKPGRHGEPHDPPAGGGCGSIAKRC
jgi:hypothetical protein